MDQKPEKEEQKSWQNFALKILEQICIYFDQTTLRTSFFLSSVGLIALALTSFFIGQGVSSFLVILVVIALVLFLLWRFSVSEDRQFLAAVFSTGFFLRLVALILLHTLSVKLGQHGFLSQFDARGYDKFAMFLVKGWQGGEFADIRAWNLAGTWDIGYYYFLAALYYLFGHSTLLGKAINCLLGASIPVVIYHLSKSVFNRQIARYSALLIALFPNLIYWSAYDLMKDTLAAFLIYLSLLFAFKVDKEGSMVFPFLVVLSLTALRLNRFYIGIILTVLILLYYLLGMWRDRQIYKQVIAFLVLIMIAEFLLAAGMHFPSFIFPLKAQIPTYSGGKIVTRLVGPKSEAFYGFKDFFGYFLRNPVKFIKQLVSGVIVFCIGPFAWMIPTSFSWDVFLFPGMWLWYLLIPFATYGLVFAKKEPPVVLLTLIVLSFFFIYSFLFAGGNFRQRAQIMQILLIFSVIGLVNFKSWKRFYPFYLGVFTLGIAAHLITRILI